MTLSNEEVNELKEKTEALIARGVDEGADVNFHDVRVVMELVAEYGIRELFDTAIAHLEREIAAARREKSKRSSRMPINVRIKNLFKLFYGCVSQ